MFVHRNTLSYRLKRIKAISGMDLEDPSSAGTDLLRILLSCRIVSR
ncbi:helix-turn-helix domain-containing protein [Paraeggerthella hominis]